MKDLNYIKQAIGDLEKRPRMYFQTREGLVAALSVYLELAGIGKLSEFYLSCFHINGNVVSGMFEKLTDDWASPIIQKAKELINNVKLI